MTPNLSLLLEQINVNLKVIMKIKHVDLKSLPQVLSLTHYMHRTCQTANKIMHFNPF